jgi:hypothetical protein
MRDLEHVDDREIFAMPHDVLMRLRDRLVVALHVGQRHDHRFLQARVVRPLAVEVLNESQRRQPFALLKERIEQQILGQKIVGPGDDERAQFDDGFVVLAGLEQRANGLVALRRRARRSTACSFGH